MDINIIKITKFPLNIICYCYLTNRKILKIISKWKLNRLCWHNIGFETNWRGQDEYWKIHLEHKQNDVRIKWNGTGCLWRHERDRGEVVFHWNMYKFTFQRGKMKIIYYDFHFLHIRNNCERKWIMEFLNSTDIGFSTFICKLTVRFVFNPIFHIVALELGNWQILLSIVESIRSSWKIALTWIYIFRGFSWPILFACRNDGELVKCFLKLMNGWWLESFLCHCLY